MADANQFLANEARTALTVLAENTIYWKSIQFLFPYYEEKSPNVKKQVSSCLETIMSRIGSENIWDVPATN